MEQVFSGVRWGCSFWCRCVARGWTTDLLEEQEERRKEKKRKEKEKLAPTFFLDEIHSFVSHEPNCGGEIV